MEKVENSGRNAVYLNICTIVYWFSVIFKDFLSGEIKLNLSW